MDIGIGYCDHPDSAIAGRTAANQALKQAGRNDICDFVLLFCTATHNQTLLRNEVARITGNNHSIIGGGASGIITRDYFGYAGNQVGVVCFWFDETCFTAINAGGLGKNETEIGLELGDKLLQQGVRPDSPVLFFYNAVKESSTSLTTATWILEGIEKQLGFFPDIMGCGLLGDHIWTPTQQFVGDSLASNYGTALTFPDSIQVEHVFLHGCRPSSPCYEITKADGSMILEIENSPAIDFMDGLLGECIKPAEYPVFLILGKTATNSCDLSDWRNYAIRFCKDIDEEQKAIIMFEPDMVAGTKFQVMSRTPGFDYMYSEIEQVLWNLRDKELLFAFYMDCAGRCAGYGGSDLEDAYVIQKTIADQCPLFGIYSGAEIASLKGKPEIFYWTGVLCLFYRNETKEKRRGVTTLSRSDLPRITPEKDLSYVKLKTLSEKNMAHILSLDNQNIAIRNELEQKRRAFRLLTDLSVSFKNIDKFENVLQKTAKRINTTLNMQKTVFLFPKGNGTYSPAVLQGYSAKEENELMMAELKLAPRLLDINRPLLVTAVDDDAYIADLRKLLRLPFFVSAPITIDNEIIGIFITGRTIEAPPFSPRLDNNDLEAIQAIVALLASTVLHQKLSTATRQAATDALTGLYNRSVLEQETTEQLELAKNSGIVAFILIDIDNFKEINDNNGHIAGDRVLKSLANMLANEFRADDVVTRFGGDEFAVIASISSIEAIEKRIETLIDKWRGIPFCNDEGQTFFSTLSIGVSFHPHNGTTYKELLHKADIALYKAKQSGRDGYMIYSR